METLSDHRPDTIRHESPLVEVMPTELKVDSPKDEGKPPGDDKKDDKKPSGPAEKKSKADSNEEKPPENTGWIHRWRKWLLGVGLLVGLVVGIIFLIPWVRTSLDTVSTDDAYINGHVTLVAPRVAGQVAKILVDDNNRVKKGDLLVQLDDEPYRVQVQLKKAALASAEADLGNAKAQVRALVAQARGQRWLLQTAIDQIASRKANLRADVATLNSKRATLELAKSNLKRGEELKNSGGVSKEELDQRQQTVKVDEAEVDQALQTLKATRVGLGLPELPPAGADLAEVPNDLEQNFPAVRTALANLIQTATQIGLPLPSGDAGPNEVLAEFRKRDANGDMDRYLDKLAPNAPIVIQSDAKLLQAQRDLDQALLNLKYCSIPSDIDGVVTSRNINPGTFVQVGQTLMAVRSLTEIWIDANFKETQLAQLRIGERVVCNVDMYGSKRHYEGRITGFTMGTGQTLALLPAQNATGNFVKIVQRLPVRIELTDYNPDRDPLFAGLSVTPYVYFKEPLAGPNAGQVLQPYLSLPQSQTDPKP